MEKNNPIKNVKQILDVKYSKKFDYACIKNDVI